MRLLIVGASTRAAAESAARSGFEVTALDAFGDLDQHPSVRSLSLQKDVGVVFGAGTAARASREIECDAVAYLSNFENHPSAVRTLASGRALWGNTPNVLRRVRNPVLVAEALRKRGFRALAVHQNDPNAPNTPNDPNDPNDPHDWVLKPLRSGGGRRVRMWRRGIRVSRGCYLQEFAEGTPASVVFVAARGRALPLMLSRQLIGEHSFGAAGFQYCGNILASGTDSEFARQEALVTTACALAQAISEEFGLVGVNGIDFVARDGIPFAVEVNPRWSSSMELVERAFGVSVFGVHAEACVSAVLPEFDLHRARRGIEAVGKAVVYARDAVTIGDTRGWLDDPSVRDVPHPGERIVAGQPICTVFANGVDSGACHAALVRRAELVYARLASWQADLKVGLYV